MKKKYKYRTDLVDSIDLDEVLKLRGNQGWLLVGFVDGGTSLRLVFVKELVFVREG